MQIFICKILVSFLKIQFHMFQTLIIYIAARKINQIFYVALEKSQEKMFISKNWYFRSSSLFLLSFISEVI